VAKLLKRSKSTIHKLMTATGIKKPSSGRVVKPRPIGRPHAITPAVYKKLSSALNSLQRQANGAKEVTLAMVKTKAGCTACVRTIQRAFHARGVRFRRLREKPILTKDDIKERLRFGLQHKRRSKTQWSLYPHAIIDNKNFPLYLNAAGREYAARRSVRGAFRSPHDALKQHLVKPKDTIKFPVKSAVITVAIVKGRIRMWHEVEGKWNGAAAARMYSGPLRKAVAKAFPGRRSWVVMEDNDPSGYKCRKGMEAKSGSKLVTLDLPKRSPDCNPLDYSLWKEINVRMRKQERGFARNFRESKAEYLRRLRRTALAIPESVVTKAVGDMHRRVQELVEKKGGLIAE